MKNYLLITFVFFTHALLAQKKMLDHTVYDNWKSIGEKLISNDGAWVVYTVNPQEGDGELVIQSPLSSYKKIIARGYGAVITEDSKFVVFKIKPHYLDTRLAKIKNLPGRLGSKKPVEVPKDSIGIIELGKDSVILKDRIKSFKTPLKGAGFVAYQLEKAPADTAKKKVIVDSLQTKNNELSDLADSLILKSLDSVKGNITKLKLTEIINKAAQQIIKEGKKDEAVDADGDDATGSTNTGGTDLILRNFITEKEKTFKWVNEFYFDKNGTKLVIETSKKNNDSASKPMLLLVNLVTEKTDTILTGFNDCKNYVFDETGGQLAFVAERDSSDKALLKFFKLYNYIQGQDSAKPVADKFMLGMQLGFGVSENARLEFSKDGSKLFFGTAPIRSPKDTTLVDFELARLDVWNYKDDYLQPQQLRNADAELKRSYTAVFHINKNKMVQLGATDAENITIVNEGNADWVLAESTRGNRVEAQWIGRSKSSAYVINTNTGERKVVYKNLKANTDASPAGKYVVWYNRELKNYFTYEVATGITRNVTDKIKVPLYEEDNDIPDLPAEYGVMGWQQADSSLYVYDRYNTWRVAPDNTKIPFAIFTNDLRAQKNTFRFINTDKDQRDFSAGKRYLFSCFNNINKQSDLFLWNLNVADSLEEIVYNKKSITARHTVSKVTMQSSFPLKILAVLQPFFIMIFNHQLK